MIALKFLRSGRVGPFSETAWPAPGSWLVAAGTGVCRTAVHACAAADLPLWLDDELWEVELRGPVTAGHGKLAAPAGRLLRRVDPWDARAAAAYAEACATRAAVLARGAGAVAAGLAVDARECAGGTVDSGLPAPAMAAGAALCAARVRALTEPGGLAAERAWQASWLSERLGLR